MDTFVRDVGDDSDLDELMARVRAAALGTGAGGSAATPAPCDAAGHDSDLIRVIDAQSQWNEHTRKALVDLLECLKMVRDDWAEAEKGLRQEMGQLSALVRQLRTTPGALSARRKPSAPAARRRRTLASSRAGRGRHATKGGKPRS